MDVQQLRRKLAAVIRQRVDVIVQAWRNRHDAAPLLDPIPTGVVGSVFVLADADPAYAGVEHAGPPVAVPWQIWVARQVGVDAEAVLDLGGTFGRHTLLGRQREERQQEDLESAHRATFIHQNADGKNNSQMACFWSILVAGPGVRHPGPTRPLPSAFTP